MMQDLTWLKPLLKKGAHTDSKWCDAGIRIRSSVVNPQNKDEIIFLMEHSILVAPTPTLFILNTTTNGMRKLNFELPDLSFRNDAPVYFCQMINVNYNNRIPNVDCQNKLIVIGEWADYELFAHRQLSYAFFGVLNLNSLAWENIETSNIERKKYIFGRRDDMVDIKCEKFFYGNWLFCHQDASLHIFHFDSPTNYLQRLFSIDLYYDYSAMILMPHNWSMDELGNYGINNQKQHQPQLEWISIVMCGGETVQFKQTFCLIKISIKHLKQLTCQEKKIMNEDDLYKIYYQHCNVNDGQNSNININFISIDNIDNIFNNYKSNDFYLKADIVAMTVIHSQISRIHLYQMNIYSYLVVN